MAGSAFSLYGFKMFNFGFGKEVAFSQRQVGIINVAPHERRGLSK